MIEEAARLLASYKYSRKKNQRIKESEDISCIIISTLAICGRPHQDDGHTLDMIVTLVSDVPQLFGIGTYPVFVC